MNELQKEHKLVRWPRLLLGVLTLLFAGVIYAWSILKAPLAAEFGWSAAQLALNFTLTMCFFGLGGLVSGLLTPKTSPKLRMLVAGLLVGAGFVIVSRMDGSSLLPLYLAYGVMAGTGIGIIYNTVIAVTNAWFPDRKGVSSGSLMMGFGFSTLLLGNLASRLISQPDLGWRSTYLLLGVAIFVVAMLCMLLIKLPPAGTVFPAAKKLSKKVDTFQGLELSAGQMLRRASFWKLFVFFTLLAAVGNTAISFAKDYCLSVGAAETLAVTVVGILSVSNGVGRIFSGIWFDNFSLRSTQILASSMAILAPTAAFVAAWSGSLWLGIVGICLCGFAYGFSPTLSAAYSIAFYGSKHFALNLSLMNLILIPASFFATLAGQLVTQTGAYLWPFGILIGLSVLGLAVNLSVKKP